MQTIQNGTKDHQPDLDLVRGKWTATCSCKWKHTGPTWSAANTALDIHLDTAPKRVSLSALTMEV